MAISGSRLQLSTTWKNIPFNKPFLDYAVWGASLASAGTPADRQEDRQHICLTPYRTYV